MKNKKQELLEQEHWEKIWGSRRLPVFRAYCGDVDIHKYLKKHINKPNLSVLEIGCAPGGYLAYFAKEFKCEVFGFDYSASCVEITRKNLTMQKIEGEIIQKDILDDSIVFGGKKFDIVCSFGLIEHFRKWPSVLQKISLFVKDSGLMISGIPNLFGVNALVSKTFRPKIFYGHNKISLSGLKFAHESLGRKIIKCDYSGPWHVSPPLSMNSFRKKYPLLSKILNSFFYISNFISKRIQQKTKKNFPSSKIFSPTILCLTIKKTKK